MVIIIKGQKNEGKTTQVKRFIDYLQKENKSVLGFYSEKIKAGKTIIGYNIITIPKKESFNFLRKVSDTNQQKIGAFYINDFTLAEGNIQINKAINYQTDFLIIDEVGKLELINKGWYVALERAFREFKGVIILAIRTEFVEKIIQKWQLKNSLILGTSEMEFKAYVVNKK